MVMLFRGSHEVIYFSWPFFERERCLVMGISALKGPTTLAKEYLESTIPRIRGILVSLDNQIIHSLP